MGVYQSDPDRAGDEEFESGRLEHLAAGNSGRLLDPRRTPLRVLGVAADTGLVRLRVLAFEDAGAIWQLPVERVDRLQFPPRGPRLAAAEVELLGDAVRRLDREEHRPRDTRRSEWTIGQITSLAEAAGRLLTGWNPPAVGSDGQTDPVLAGAASTWWRRHGVAGLESRFTRAWASNPAADETVKAHQMVLAGLGLVDYRGQVLRDPARLAGRESARRRERHLLARLAFVRAMFAAADIRQLTLYRGYALSGGWQPERPASLVSATADRAVALAHFDGGTPAGLLQRAVVSVDRVLMTWRETPQLSAPYRESEVTLIAADPASALF